MTRIARALWTALKATLSLLVLAVLALPVVLGNFSGTVIFIYLSSLLLLFIAAALLVRKPTWRKKLIMPLGFLVCLLTIPYAIAVFFGALVYTPSPCGPRNKLLCEFIGLLYMVGDFKLGAALWILLAGVGMRSIWRAWMEEKNPLKKFKEN